MSDENLFEPLKNYLSKVPAITGKIGSGFLSDGCWWVKFTIDTEHPLAWSVVQELAHVLNYLSLDEKLPTVFMPVSPLPDMNGDTHDYLSWVIECNEKDFKPQTCVAWLEGRLPRPVSEAGKDRFVMSFWQVTKAIVTDSHFLIPFGMFLVGIALLLLLR
jgi:hypothetical protein